MRNKLLLIVFLLIIFISFVNIFPEGYIFSGADVVQFHNVKNNLKNYLYTWSNLLGEGSPLLCYSYSLYYLPFFLLSFLFSASKLSFLFFFLFLTSSFFSFFLGTKIFLKDQSEKYTEFRILVSLIYALNPYTLYVFLFIWGYSPLLILYPFIPLLFILTYLYFEKSDLFNKQLASLGIVYFFSNIAFGNISFLVSLILFLGIFVMLLYLFKIIEINVKKIFLYSILAFFSCFWSVIPQIVQSKTILSQITGPGAFWDLRGWILWQRLNILEQFFLTPSIKAYGIFSILSPLWILLFIISFAGIIYKKNKLSVIFLFLALFSIFITSKGKGILNDTTTLKIFTLPIINTLRSYSKTFIFLPFFIIFPIFLQFHNFYPKHRRLFLSIILILILSVYPFFTGKIQKSAGWLFKKGDSYKTAKYSGLVKIPDEYYLVSDKLNQEKTQSKIFHLPYSVINSVGWVNYPKWKVVGVDPTIRLFKKPSIQPNSFFSFNFNYGRKWNNTEVNKSKWIINLMSLTNAEYLIYHKDVDDRFIEQTKDKIYFLRKNKDIELLESYENFDLYKIPDKNFLPHIYASMNDKG